MASKRHPRKPKRSQSGAKGKQSKAKDLVVPFPKPLKVTRAMTETEIPLVSKAMFSVSNKPSNQDESHSEDQITKPILKKRLFQHSNES